MQISCSIMNWVGGARSRVKQKNERKLQREFFEHRRVATGQVKRQRSSSPMKVNYKRLISQDLVCLQTLSDVHDSEINKQVNLGPHKTVQRVILDKPQSGRSYNFNLELPMSPITQPSTLELLDATTDGTSLYGNQPRVSTTKKPEDIFKLPSSNETSFDSMKNTFWTTDSIFSCEDSTRNTSTLTESVFPKRKNIVTVDDNNTDLSATTESIFPLNRTTHKPKMHNSIVYSTNDPFKPVESRFGIDAPVYAPRKPRIPDISVTKSVMDTEKPIPAHSLYSWEDVKWYGNYGNESTKLKAQPDISVTKSVMDTERPIPTHSLYNWEDVKGYGNYGNKLRGQTSKMRQKGIMSLDRETPFPSLTKSHNVTSLTQFHKDESFQQPLNKTKNKSAVDFTRSNEKNMFSTTLLEEDPMGMFENSALYEKNCCLKSTDQSCSFYNERLQSCDDVTFNSLTQDDTLYNDTVIPVEHNEERVISCVPSTVDQFHDSDTIDKILAKQSLSRTTSISAFEKMIHSFENQSNQETTRSHDDISSSSIENTTQSHCDDDTVGQHTKWIQFITRNDDTGVNSVTASTPVLDEQILEECNAEGNIQKTTCSKDTIKTFGLRNEMMNKDELNGLDIILSQDNVLSTQRLDTECYIMCRNDSRMYTHSHPNITIDNITENESVTEEVCSITHVPDETSPPSMKYTQLYSNSSKGSCNNDISMEPENKITHHISSITNSTEIREDLPLHDSINTAECKSVYHDSNKSTSQSGNSQPDSFSKGTSQSDSFNKITPQSDIARPRDVSTQIDILTDDAAIQTMFGALCDNQTQTELNSMTREQHGLQMSIGTQTIPQNNNLIPTCINNSSIPAVTAFLHFINTSGQKITTALDIFGDGSSLDTLLLVQNELEGLMKQVDRTRSDLAYQTLMLRLKQIESSE